MKSKSEISKKPKKKNQTQQLSLSINSDEDSVCNEKESQLSLLIDKLNRQLKEQNKFIKNLSSSYEFMSSNFDQLQVELKNIQQQNREIKKDVQKLQSNETNLKNRISTLEEYVIKSKQDGNINNMIITNLPKFSKETDMRNVINKIAEQVEYNVSKEDILDVYQADNKKRKSYPIIVKLRNDGLKRKYMEFRKAKKTINITDIAPNMNNGGKNVNFHHLMEKEFAELLTKAKEIAAKKEFKFVWFAKSTVLVRKAENTEIIKIKTNKDLKMIK